MVFQTPGGEWFDVAPPYQVEARADYAHAFPD
jgi:hypothetical protein